MAKPKSGDGPDGPADLDRTLKGLGQTLGGWARRAAEVVAEVSESVSLPESVRAGLAAAAEARWQGRWDDAEALARDQLEAAPAPAVAALGLLSIHRRACGDAPANATALELPEGVQVAEEIAAVLAAAEALDTGPMEALDTLRRSRRSSSRLSASDARELAALRDAVEALAHARLNRDGRALREAEKFWMRSPQTPRALGLVILRRALRCALTVGDLGVATDWARRLDAKALEQEGRESLALLAAATGDAAAACRPSDPAELRTQVGLILGRPDDQAARELLVQRPDAPPALRLWALTRFADGDRPSAADVQRALVRAVESCPSARRPAYVAELCHVALAWDLPADAVSERDARDAGLEGALWLAWRHGTAVPRSVAESHLPAGPDLCSPLRDPVRRSAVAQGIAAALRARAKDPPDPRDWVETLAHLPSLGAAIAALASRFPAPEPGLEAELDSATELLSAIAVGASHETALAVRLAQSEVVRARERLARPLTIAIMGEFSSGKSTVVNALLGTQIAPVGALPTTSTINVFRRGDGGARVVMRDDHVETLDTPAVHAFLTGLDEERAGAVRHVEVDVSDASLDARVVDTPGLNALDPYHERIARAFVDEADAIVWVFSATSAGAASESGMLAELGADGRRVLGVLNKVDTVDEHERAELVDFVGARHKEVLAELVTTRGDAMLKARVQGQPHEDFQRLRSALDTHFLANARELKQRVVRQRVGAALQAARVQVVEEIDAQRGQDITAVPLRSELGLERVGAAVGDTTEVRRAAALELLALGAGDGGEVDPPDAGYLSRLVREAVELKTRRAIDDAPDAVAPVLLRTVAAWVEGYLAGAIDDAWATALIAACNSGPAREARFSDLAAEALAEPTTAIARRIASSHGAILTELRAEHARAVGRQRAAVAQLEHGVLAALDRLIARIPGDTQP